MHNLDLRPSKLIKKYGLLYTVCRERWDGVSGMPSYKWMKSAGC